MSLNVQNLNSLYEYTRSAIVEELEVGSDLVDQLCEAHWTFQQAILENPDDLLLENLLRSSARLRFRILSAPLPFNHPQIIDSEATDILLKQISNVAQSYGKFRDACDLYTETFTELRRSDENPLLRALQVNPKYKINTSSGFVIKVSKLASAIQETLIQEDKDATVLSENQLRKVESFRRLYLFGAGRWYPGFVFSAPRAPKICIVRYAVLDDAPPDEVAFVKTLKPPSKPTFSGKSQTRVKEFSGVDAIDVLPTLDFATILARTGAPGSDHHSFERVEAKALILEQDLGVFIHAADGSTELVIDLREGAEKLVGRVEVGDLEPEMAIIVRTEGGGDFVVAAADLIMGGEAEEARKNQRFWKRELLNLVDERGSTEVVSMLSNAGSRIASYQNLLNWMNFRSIRTQKKEDFEAIFRVIGRAELTDAYWKFMGAISIAHQMAGVKIRRQLLDQINQVDLFKLKIEGLQIFELPGEVGGNLTAVRIVAISPDVVEVPSSAIHQLIEMVD